MTRTVGGIDRDGTGAVYSFDPVGSYERESCRAAGSAQSLIQPFLDQQVRHMPCPSSAGLTPRPQVMARNTVPSPDDAPIVVDGFSNLPIEKVMGIVTDTFTRSVPLTWAIARTLLTPGAARPSGTSRSATASRCS